MSRKYTDETKNMERLRQILHLVYVDGYYRKGDFGSFFEGAQFYTKENFEDEFLARENEKSKTHLSLDSRKYRYNPIYRTFCKKSYMDSDLAFFFKSFQLGEEGSVEGDEEGCEIGPEDYLSSELEIEDEGFGGLTSIKARLNELKLYGIIEGRTNLISTNNPVISEHLYEALSFFSEAMPLGVLGYYMLRDSDKPNEFSWPFIFKHDFLNYALDSDVLCQLLTAIRGGRWVSFTSAENVELVANRKAGNWHTEIPLKIFSSTQDGRQYLCTEKYFYRLDRIHNVSIGNNVENLTYYKEDLETSLPYFWSPSIRRGELYDFDMTIQVDKDEYYVVECLEKERRGLSFEQLNQNRYRVYGKVNNSRSMWPWIRRFYGHIVSLCETDPRFLSKIENDLEDTLDSHLLEQEAFLARPVRRGKDKKDRSLNLDDATIMYESLFHEMFSNDYRFAGRLLDDSLTMEDILEIARSESVSEVTATHIVDVLVKHGLLSFDGQVYSSQLEEGYSRPMTNLEKRWLRAMFEDHRIKLFEVSIPKELKEVEPLFSNEDICYFDQYLTGDDFSDATYVANFRLILKAINEKRFIKVSYNGKTFACFPRKLEYSKKDNRFRLLNSGLNERHQVGHLNLSKMASVQIEDQNPESDEEWYNREIESREVTVLIEDSRDTKERFLLHFSPFRRESTKLDDCHWKVKLSYDVDMEREIVNGIIGFGANVHVLTPPSISDELLRRLRAQKDLWSSNPTK